MNLPPSLLSFNRVGGTGAAPQWRLQFSEPVTGLRAGDVTLAGEGTYASAASVLSVVPEGDGSSWLLRVSAGPGEGRLVPTLRGGNIRDLDGTPMTGIAPRLADSQPGSASPVALLDANGDGLLDMVASDQVRLNLDGVSFAAATPLAGAVGGGVPLAIDGDGDGRLDLVAGSAPQFFRSLGDGGFAAPVALDLGGQPAFAGDFNGDGRQDILSIDTAGVMRVALGTGAGFASAFTITPAARTGADPGVAVADVNGDGRADLAVVEGQAVRLWLGQADGRLVAGNSYQGAATDAQIAFARTNADGFADLVIVKGGSATVRLGDGAGGFVTRVDSAFASPLAIGPGRGIVGDFTGDGLADVVTSVVTNVPGYNYTTQASQLYLSRGVGDGAFGAVENLGVSAGMFQASGDLDGNGTQDLIGTVFSSVTYQVYQPCIPFGPGFVCGIGNYGNSYYQTTTSIAQNVVLSLPPPTTGQSVSNFPPPQVLSAVATPANGTLYVNDAVFITLTFDKPVTVAGGTALWLDNGAAAIVNDQPAPSQLRFKYTAAVGDADADVGIAGVSAGIRGLASNEAADSSGAVGALPGILRVDTPSSMLFENADGRIALWQFDGTTIARKALLAEAGIRSDMVAVIDSATGGDWLLSRCGCGTVYVAPVSLQAAGAAQPLGYAGAEWSLAGEAAQGASQARLFWHHTAGQLAFWDMDTVSGRQVAGVQLGAATLDWRVAAIADTDGDRQADVLWQNQDGRVARWRVEGSSVTSQKIVDVVTPDWKLVSAGDLNGDGRADLFYRNAGDNRLVVRFMNGDDGIGDNQVVGAATSDWSIVDLRDMNGDGREDILWRNPSGDFALWTMDGAVPLQKMLLDHVSADWQLLT